MWPSRPILAGSSPTPTIRPPNTSICRSSISARSTFTCTTWRRFAVTCSRLQNLVGDKPLVLGELGMDTLRHGEVQQADMQEPPGRSDFDGLRRRIRFRLDRRMAHGRLAQIKDWAFGITRADRSPKASYHALGEVYVSARRTLVGPASSRRDLQLQRRSDAGPVSAVALAPWSTEITK